MESLVRSRKRCRRFFIRIHNRYLVNLKYVDKLEASSLECGGQSLPVSRAYKQATAVAFAKLMLK